MKTLSEVATALGAAIADFCEHPESPQKEVDELSEFFLQMVNTYDDVTSVTIRRDFAWLVEKAVALREWPQELNIR
jgi:hypothetical protein